MRMPTIAAVIAITAMGGMWYIFFKRLITRSPGSRLLQFIAAVGLTDAALALHFWSLNGRNELLWLSLGGVVLTLIALDRDRKVQSAG